jgi:hypothetical protein
MSYKRDLITSITDVRKVVTYRAQQMSAEMLDVPDDVDVARGVIMPPGLGKLHKSLHVLET